MTVQDTTPATTFVGTGLQLVFVFTFRADDVTWLGVDYLVNFDKFTVNADQDNNPGGTVEYTVAPPALQELTVTRDTPNTQELDYTRYDPFDSESTEDSIDKLTMQIQDLQYLITSTLTQELDLLDDVDTATKVDGSMLYWDDGAAMWMDTAAQVRYLAGTFTVNAPSSFQGNVSFEANASSISGNFYRFLTPSNVRFANLQSEDIPDRFLISTPNIAEFAIVGFSAVRPTYNGGPLALLSDVVAGSSPLTTKGDIFVFAAVDTRLPVGADGEVLSANSVQATGLEWIVLPSGITDGNVAGDTTIWDGAAWSPTSSLSWDDTNKSLTMGLTAAAQVAIRVTSTSPINYVALRMEDQTGANFFAFQHNYSLSSSNHEFLLTSQVGTIWEIEAGGEIWLSGTENNARLQIVPIWDAVRVSLGATLFIQGTATPNANSGTYGQFWVSSVDDLPYYTDDLGATFALTGTPAFGNLPDGLVDNAALKWDDGGQVWETAAGRLTFNTDVGAQTSIITSDSVLILGASSQVRIDPAVTTFYAEYTNNNSFISFEGAGFKHIQTGTLGGGLAITAGNGTANLVLAGGTVLEFTENAAPNADVLTRGQIWLSSADNLPYYRNEVGTDFTLTGAVAGADHGALIGLADDDHINYFYALGRAGGQSMIGGTGPVESIELRGSSDADLGTIFMQSPVEFQSISASGAPYAFNYAAVESYTAAFVGGGLNMSGTIGFTHSTMIYESFRGAPQITSNVNPGFAAYTVMQALPSLIAGPGAGNRPLNATIINAGPRFNNPFAGTRTTPSAIGVSNTPQLNPSVNGAVMNLTNITGFVFTPGWNTVAGSTANFGTIRGMWARNPSQVLFGSSAGTEIGVAYYGYDVDNITLNNGIGTMPVAAFRSAVQPSASKFMLLNTGGAESDFGFGDIHLNDSTWLKLGNTVANPDMIIGWEAAQAAVAFSTFFGVGGNPLYLRATAADEWTFQQNNSGTQDIGLGFNVNAVSFGVVAPTPNSNNWFVRFEGPNNRQVQSAGAYSDVWWTAGGLIDVNGLAATEINSFRIDANVTVLNGGSVLDQSGLFIAGMGFPGSGLATRIQSLRVTGRARIDGAMNFGSLSPAQLTASVNDYQLGISNSQRSINLLTSDAAWNITGIDITGGNTYGQPGDRICLHNVGAFNITLTHQDVASLAVHRIITSTGVGYVIGPDECVWLWYDDTGVARWRMQEGTGA